MTLRFGLLGTGYWAAEAHAAGLVSQSDASLVGVWGRDPDRATAVAERYRVRAYPELDDLLADVDAVAIAVPPDVQAELAVRAAAAGRHLLLDKPLALTRQAADRVVAEVERAGVASVIFYTNRYHPNVAAFLDDTIATGGWDGARVTMYASIFQPGNPFGVSPWRRERGGLWDIGPHALSLVLPVLGPVTEVTAVDAPHDTVHLILRHASGGVSTIGLTLDAPPAVRLHEFLFTGENGTAEVPAGDGTSVDAFRVAVGQLAANVATGVTTHPCDVRFGAQTVAVLETAETARERRATVPLSP